MHISSFRKSHDYANDFFFIMRNNKIETNFFSLASKSFRCGKLKEKSDDSC